MVGFPAHVEDVGESEVAIFRSGRREGLPGLVLVAGTTEGNDAADFGVLCEAAGGGGTVGAAGEDDVIPAKIAFVLIQKVAPFPLWILLGEIFDELEGALLEGVGLGDGDFVGVVFAGGGFEADVSPAVLGDGSAFAANAEPLVGIVDADGVEPMAIELSDKVAVVSHEPDHELAARRDAGIDTGVLEIGRLSALRFDKEIDLWMGLNAGIDLAGSRFQLIELRFWVIEGGRGRVGVGGEN